jgi:hypothetical protein
MPRATESTCPLAGRLGQGRREPFLYRLDVWIAIFAGAVVVYFAFVAISEEVVDCSLLRKDREEIECE